MRIYGQWFDECSNDEISGGQVDDEEREWSPEILVWIDDDRENDKHVSRYCDSHEGDCDGHCGVGGFCGRPDAFAVTRAKHHDVAGIQLDATASCLACGGNSARRDHLVFGLWREFCQANL